MKALVTGASGFIGRRLVAALKTDGRFSEVHSLFRRNHLNPRPYEERPCPWWDASINDNNDAYWLLNACKPDVIFHLAAVSRLEGAYLDGLWDANVLGTKHLIDHASPACRFVFASSAAVYGNMTAETGKWCEETDDTLPICDYGASKLCGEALLHSATSLGRLRGVALRLVANCGGGATHGLVRAVIQKLRSDSPTLDLFGDESGTRKPFLHVYDTVQALIVAALSDATGVFNVSPDDALSVRGVAHTVMETLGIHKPVTWGGPSTVWPGDQKLLRVSGAKMRGLGWKPAHWSSGLAVARAAQEVLDGCL